MIPRTMIEQCGSYEFAMEPFDAALISEIDPMHRRHWAETEGYRDGLPFEPRYDRLLNLASQGRYVVFTVRLDGVLVGDCSVHLYESAHTSTLAAKEDSLFLMPSHRVGRLGFRFFNYVIGRLTEIGARELNVTAKVGTRSERFFERAGMTFVAREYHLHLGAKPEAKE